MIVYHNLCISTVFKHKPVIWYINSAYIRTIYTMILIPFTQSRKDFDDWYDAYIDIMKDMFMKILDTLHDKSYKYYPITSMQIDDESLYSTMVLYVYNTSYNNDKKYRLRNL